MAVIERRLPHRAEESDRRLAGRNRVPQQQVRQRRAAHRSGMERIEHRSAVGKVAFDGQRTTRHHSRHHRLAGRLQGGEQFALGALQVQVGEGVGLSRKDSLLSQEDEDDIGAARG